MTLMVLLYPSGSYGTTPITAASDRPSARGDWSQFRFGPQHHGFNPFETILSPSTVRGLEEQWSTPTGQAIASSPAVVNGVLYVASLDVEGKVYALDIATGAVLWAAPPGVTGGFQASPAVKNGVVYVTSLYGAVYALDAATGNTVWTGGDQFGQIVASPVVADGVVYVGYNSGLLQALDAATGAALWTAEAGASIYSSPAVAGGRVFVASNNGKVRAFDAASGNELWTADTSLIMWSSPG